MIFPPNLPTNSVTVDFHLGDPDAGGTLLGSAMVNLAGGFVSEEPITTSGLPAGADGLIFVRIDPANTIAESDESNNSATTALNPVDLVAEEISWSYSGDESILTLTGTVRNDGRTTQTNIPVEIHGDQGQLPIATIPTLDSGVSIEVTGDLATGTAFPTLDNRFVLKVDPADTFGDADLSNNETGRAASRGTSDYLTDSDTDNDGMHDIWEQATFGTLDRDGTGDFDGDGARDLFEFLTLTDARDPASRVTLSIERDVANDGGVIVAIPAIPGVAYTIQRSNNLSEWLDYSFFAGDDSTFVVPVPGLGGGTPSTGEPTFFRVRIEGDQ